MSSFIFLAKNEKNLIYWSVLCVFLGGIWNYINYYCHPILGSLSLFFLLVLFWPSLVVIFFFFPPRLSSVLVEVITKHLTFTTAFRCKTQVWNMMIHFIKVLWFPLLPTNYSECIPSFWDIWISVLWLLPFIIDFSNFILPYFVLWVLVQ